MFESSTINRKVFNRLRKIFSVSRNLGLYFVLCSQRLQDLNTKIRGRTRLLLGQVSLDDYELKIRRLLKNSEHRDDVLSLPVGSFLYPSLDTIVKFPRFIQKGNPYELYVPEEVKQPEPLEQPKQGILYRLLTALVPRGD